MVSVVAAVLCFVGYYNFRVTGTPFRMPYMIHEAQYAAAPVFLWMKPQPMPVHLHRVIADAHATALRYYYKQQTIRGFVAELWVRLLYFKLYLWHYIPALFLPGLFIAVKRDIFPRLALVTWVGVVCVTIFQTWLLPHYLAPILPLEIALILFGMIEVEKWTWRGKPSGRFIVRITAFMLCGLSITFFCISRVKHEKYDSWEYDRPLVIHRLEKLEGQHLVVVKYQPNHNGFREWVYNGADIDGSKVVFAQDMGAERNARLIDYFQARKLWILDPDASPPDLQPYERN
jgi:hypothetical protein